MNEKFIKLRRRWKDTNQFWRVTILHLDSVEGEHTKESFVDNVKRLLIKERDQQKKQHTSSVGDLPLLQMINAPYVKAKSVSDLRTQIGKLAEDEVDGEEETL
ncbi:hypothetical protein F2Q69_00035512 [Brassica cretica]|uniref:Uncharacterized protein n=1 Tax=Brassica cretica TaxID=69181 RepID=A0A8S9SU33_BRACR|nr:hypothetical protein F2Q69_00035512 [Brassica cretica]